VGDQQNQGEPQTFARQVREEGKRQSQQLNLAGCRWRNINRRCAMIELRPMRIGGLLSVKWRKLSVCAADFPNFSKE
jgi:hypothetical protein